ncbi:HNH endonuclease signature motif containing protein [Actinomarinicola tropica]|uniref:DUF222 domain-containing protein n=1 Tax=Actinomarinicola tropica TaxID=2789776 RepID=A0A5Q2RLK7_9ACTN|nr:HNH endonuclease signature motif containing protein [Actinomarinicola tropica]QGG94740.1 DUF222 domain-containing protein [Actinomarinicola tropica]
MSADTAVRTERIGALVVQLGDAIDELAAHELSLDDAPALSHALLDLMRRGSQLETVTAEVGAQVDSSTVWTDDGSRSCAAWLSRATARPRHECATLLRLGRAVRTMPHVAAAWRRGALSTWHVEQLVAAARKVPGAFPDAERWLVARADELDADGFAQVVRHWRLWAAPDDAEEDAVDRYRRRRLHLSPGLDGTGFMDVEFDPVGFETFSTALTRIEHEMWEEDWADARRRLGDAATRSDLARTDAQRRDDALIEMSRRASSTPPGSRPPAPLVTVHVDHETLTVRICELSNGTQLTPGEVLPLLTAADIERAVFDPAGRIIDLGRRSRLFVAGTRRVVEIRDRACTHPTCRVPAERCDVDHVVEWQAGGSTSPDNGQLRCPSHHRERHRPQARRPRRRRRDGSGGSGSAGDEPPEP